MAPACCEGGGSASHEVAPRAVVRGAPEVGHLASPDRPPPGRALGVGVRCPLSGGAGVRARGPVARVLCGVMRAAGAAGSCPRGEPLTAVGGIWRQVRRSPSPGCPPPGQAVGVRCLRVLGAGAWLRGSGTVPPACTPCEGLRAAGGGGESWSWGEWPLIVVRGFWCQALSLSRPPVPGGKQPGPVARVFPSAGGVGVGTQRRPHSALVGRRRALLGWREGVLARGDLSPLCRASGVRSFAPPGSASLGAGRRGLLPTCRGRVVRAWEPGTVPLACMPCGDLRAAGVA